MKLLSLVTTATVHALSLCLALPLLQLLQCIATVWCPCTMSRFPPMAFENVVDVDDDGDGDGEGQRQPGSPTVQQQQERRLSRPAGPERGTTSAAATTTRHTPRIPATWRGMRRPLAPRRPGWPHATTHPWGFKLAQLRTLRRVAG